MAKPKNRQKADDYDVGYGRPPKHTRFKKGQSGNPRGRPRGAKNFATDLAEVLRETVTVREGDKAKTVSKQRGATMSLVAKALKGDARSLSLLIAAVERFQPVEADASDSETLPVSDAEILQRFVVANLGAGAGDAHTEKKREWRPAGHQGAAHAA